MAFPEMRTEKHPVRWLGIVWYTEERTVTVGWKWKEPLINVWAGKILLCDACGSTIHVGEENKKRFLFCPAHMQKLKHKPSI